MSYDSEVEENDNYQKILDEEKKFDDNWDRIKKLKEEFEEESPSDLFNLLSIPEFEDMLLGKYKPKRNYFKKEKLEGDMVFPSVGQYNPEPKTEAEIIEEKKGLIIFGYENPPCNNCRGCRRKRGKKCRNQGKMISKPLYPELHKVKILTPELTPEPVKTIFDTYNEKRKSVKNNTGKVWGDIKPSNQIDLTKNMKKNKEEDIRNKEEERLRIIEKEKRDKQLDEDKKRREEQQRESQERRRYFREKKEREQQYKRQNRKTTGRFSNLF